MAFILRGCFVPAQTVHLGPGFLADIQRWPLFMIRGAWPRGSTTVVKEVIVKRSFYQRYDNYVMNLLISTADHKPMVCIGYYSCARAVQHERMMS